MNWNKIPIAMLHHVSSQNDWNSLAPFVIQESTFSRFLDTIEARRKQTITFRELERSSNRSQGVIITFDDCGKHLLDFAVPELVKRNMKAVFFMPTANIGGHNSWNVKQGKSRLELMNRKDLIELHNLGMEIGGHSHDHTHLSELTETETLDQLNRSSNILTDILGTPPVSLAYPYGSIPKCASTVLTKTNFDWGCSIFSRQPSKHTLRRFIVHDGDNEMSMRAKLHFGYSIYRNWTDRKKE